MKIKYKSFIPMFFLAALVLTSSLLYFGSEDVDTQWNKIRSSSSPKASIEMKKARGEYFFNLLKDPATNKMPENIRARELEFARLLSKGNSSINKSNSSALNWKEAGPNDVGGRTRAIGVDVSNSNNVIVGGVAGGIWKSTDNSASWTMKSTLTTVLSVTSIAQDPRPGFTNNWYYTSGERQGSGSANFTAMFGGDGIYKSTDNGETWSILPSTMSTDPTSWESIYDYVEKIIVSPINGNVFIGTNGHGIYRSTDGGASFQSVLGQIAEHDYSDISVGANGTLVAVISDNQFVTAANPPGIYKSVDHGASWTNITPAGYPQFPARSVVAIAPSNNDVAYVLNYTGQNISQNEEIIKFYKINIGAGTSVDRSNNLPAFRNGGGRIFTQGSYDMSIAVKPDDENFVLIAGTSLFRSTDGFATQPTDSAKAWIGGYGPFSFFYPNFHPDVHSNAFDPSDPNKMWWGHDGGLSYTSDITNTNYAQNFPWQKKNNSYNVTQFYMIAIADIANDNRIMGGTQDNGSPSFTFNGTSTSASEDVSSGDGAFAYFATNFAYTSSQNGTVNRLRYDGQGNPSFNNGWTQVKPLGASNQLFIHPFTLDPNNHDVMYYPAGADLWRNNALSTIPEFLQPGTNIGWTKLDNLAVPAGYIITALEASKNPANILYYAASGAGAPKIYRLANSTTATSGAVEVSIPGAPANSYIFNLAVNPDDADEILAVLSNYNIVGLYHSSDGGQTYTAVEGNLTGTAQNPGPSLRDAAILPSNDGKTYFVATSIGLFSTTGLNGANTNWTQEGANTIGNVIVQSLASRKSDGVVVAGTHGRGVFKGTTGVTDVDDNSITAGNYVLEQNYPNPFNPTTSINFTLPKNENVKLNVFNSTGELVKTLVNRNLSSGSHSLEWNAENNFGIKLASGVYFYELNAGSFIETRKMILLK
ncbi:MAG: T9SS type A sorting domain-containing protein [Ignavibacteriae bacterium]|nr:T9SS C-terminal target domain-containing protein [Ignavibacteriota bacterium]NOG97614.1 T9SS type A sorting domain-containing protein [Ignavibacteriota bacterium]